MQKAKEPRKPQDSIAPMTRQDLQINATANQNGDDESLENSSPTDTRSDEKVIVNEQLGDKTVNEPSQTAANASENISSDEEIINKP